MTGALASGLLEELLAAQRPAEYLSSARALKAGSFPELRTLRVGILGSCTLQFAAPYLVVEAARRGYLLDVHFAAFGQFEQVLADAGSPLRAFDPEVLVLLLRPEDVLSDDLPRAVDHSASLEGLATRLGSCVDLVRAWTRAPVLVANFAVPAQVPLGIFDANLPESLALAMARANMALQKALAGRAGAYVWDYAGLVATHGTAAWTDRRLWALARVPIAAALQPALASHLIRTLNGVFRPPAKCLVLDLDNTLWGGVVGDDGLSGIELGDDHPGSAFRSFQRFLRGLLDRGILLAVASKNDTEVVEQVFREHPEMLLRREDIAALRANWEPKSGNLRAIAAELNIGADALAFFDDNPVERAEVRANAPEVAVIDVPSDPLLYAQAVIESGYFDQPAISSEDQARAEMYRVDQVRRVVEQGAASVEEFLATLGMVATVGVADAATLGRIAQLVGKTNQFNLTTRRHSQVDLAAMMADPQQVVAWLRLRDRFGDQGLVAVAVLVARAGIARIDTFLMSCRVLNRGVEQAMIAFLAGHARRLECTRLLGEHLATKKNSMVRDFYLTQGFSPTTGEGEGTWFACGIADAATWPEVIQREDAQRAGDEGMEPTG